MYIEAMGGKEPLHSVPTSTISILRLKMLGCRDAWLAQSVEHVTLDLLGL